MATTTESTQEQLTYKLGLQIFLTIAAIVFTMLFTLPKLETVNEQVETANIALENYDSMYKKGISKADLPAAAARVGNNSELIEIIKSAGDSLTPFITNSTSKPYIEWLKNATNENEADQAKLADMQAKINSIIPTLSPLMSTKTQNNNFPKSVTLREFVTFVEQNILAKFNIQSLSPLGIDGITYKENKDGVLENPVGEFTMDLSFKATNKNISELLTYIQGL